MPRGDGTGPLGSGPMSGWGMGSCAGFAVGGSGMRRFFGRCAGFGRRVWGGVPGNASANPELDRLREQAGYARQSLSRIEKRISEIEGE